MKPQPNKNTPAPVAKREIRELLTGDDFRNQIAMALPRHLKPERFIRIALTATMRNPKLLECDRESFFKCLLDLSSWGLEPDGRRAHLIPYWNSKRNTFECQLIVDYKGLVELVRKSGDVTDLHADVVRTGDEFTFSYGVGSTLVHKPALKDAGEVIGAYSFARLKDGSPSFDVMTVEQIEATRKRSRAAESGPWVTDWPEMAKKTVFRRHSKWLNLSAEVRDVIERDDDQFEMRIVEPAEPKRPIFRGLKEGPEVRATLEEDSPPPVLVTPSRVKDVSGHGRDLVLEGQTEEELAQTQAEEDALWKGADQDGGNAA